jgi:hypothetical protein
MMLSAAETQSMIRDLGGETLVYKWIGSPSHDVASGEVVNPSLNYSIDGVWAQYEKSEVDNAGVRPNDARVVMSAFDFSFTPTLNDKILRGSEVWNVLRVVNQPNDPFIEFQLRRP